VLGPNCYNGPRRTEINKSCLSAFDDKRYILNDGVHILAYGHESIARLHAPLDGTARMEKEMARCMDVE